MKGDEEERSADKVLQPALSQFKFLPLLALLNDYSQREEIQPRSKRRPRASRLLGQQPCKQWDVAAAIAPT